MTSISPSDYRKHCADLVLHAVKRPRMYYSELPLLEAVLDGHWLAFEQICGVERSMSFQDSFSAWLDATRSVSVSCGWAYAITELAAETNADPDTLFADLVNEFLPGWIESNNNDESH